MPLSLFLRGFYLKSVAVLFLLFTTLILAGSFMAKDDLVNKILLDNQQRILNRDLVIRDSVLANYNRVKGFDSISRRIMEGVKDSSAANKIFRDFVLINLTDGFISGNVLMDKSNVSWGDYGLLDYDSLQVVIRVEKDKLMTILKSSQSEEEDQKLIKFGNYLSNETKYKLRPRFDLLVMLLLMSMLLPVLFFYWLSKRKEKEKDPIDQVEKQIAAIRQLPKDDFSKRKEQIDILYTMLKEVYPIEDKIDVRSLLEADYDSFKSKSREMHERSSFLVFAFAISIGGVIIFYFLLPQYNAGAKFTDYLGITIRPILLLSFFQTLAFYLLKQYKGSMEDYKFFYLEARNRKRFSRIFDTSK